jgi:stage II sporulation protein D
MPVIELVLMMLAAGSDSPAVRVNVLSSHHPRELLVITGSDEVALCAQGEVILVDGESRGAYQYTGDGFTLRWKDNSRKYAGSLEARADRGELILVNEVGEDDYLASVTAGEMVPGAGPEALKAQAVLCRTFLYSCERHSAEDWDFCDLTHCQSYKGLASVSSHSRRAVAGTEGLVLAFAGELCEVYYHSTSGGRTADASSIWADITAPYLVSVDDPLCTASPHYSWESTLTSDQIARALGLPHVSDLEILTTASDGRVTAIEVSGSDSGTWPGWQFRMAVCQELGWNTLKSSWFEIDRVGDSFVFTGKGLGHGVGLSQWGAAGMADRGDDFRTILAHFYTGTEVFRWR